MGELFGSGSSRFNGVVRFNGAGWGEVRGTKHTRQRHKQKLVTGKNWFKGKYLANCCL